MQISTARPSAVLTYLGSASLLRHSEVPLILNLTASTVQSNHTNKVLISTVEQSLRSCIHKRLSMVWKWEITTIDSAEETEIS